MPTRKITIYIEDADGVTDEVTGIHADNGDGTASWIAGAALDTTQPSKSPIAWRDIGRRLRDDAAEIPKFIPKTPKVAPVREEILAESATVIAP